MSIHTELSLFMNNLEDQTQDAIKNIAGIISEEPKDTGAPYPIMMGLSEMLDKVTTDIHSPEFLRET